MLDKTLSFKVIQAQELKTVDHLNNLIVIKLLKF